MQHSVRRHADVRERWHLASSKLLAVLGEKLLVIRYLPAEAEFHGDDRVVADHITTTVGGVPAGHVAEADSARHSEGSCFTESTLTREMTEHADSKTLVRISMERDPAREDGRIYATVSGNLLDQKVAS